jgi:hypothetical protein
MRADTLFRIYSMTKPVPVRETLRQLVYQPVIDDP